MCIVADSVENVSKTKIASFHVAYSLDGGKTVVPSQLVVYSANVDSSANTNAFILPVYNPGNHPHKIIPLDLSHMANFFDDIKRLFERWFPRPRSYASTNSASFSYDSEDLLEVHRVGDYQFSIMPSRMDFNRIDRSRLNINPTAKIAIDVHSDDYSFIVYQFYQRGKLEITPFGYLCPPCGEQSMVIPTIHGHPHDTIPNIGIGYVPSTYINYKSDFDDEAEFDHEIYGLVKNTGSSIISKQDMVDVDRLLKQIRCDYMDRKIRIYVPRNFYPKKLELKGFKPNRNMELRIGGHTYVRDLTVDRAY